MSLAAALLVLSWSLSYSMAESSSAAALHIDADCEKNFARGVEAYELGLQVRRPVPLPPRGCLAASSLLRSPTTLSALKKL